FSFGYAIVNHEGRNLSYAGGRTVKDFRAYSRYFDFELGGDLTTRVVLRNQQLGFECSADYLAALANRFATGPSSSLEEPHLVSNPVDFFTVGGLHLVLNIYCRTESDAVGHLAGQLRTAVSRLRLSDPQRHRLYISAFVPFAPVFNETLGLRLHAADSGICRNSYSPKLACDAPHICLRNRDEGGRNLSFGGGRTVAGVRDFGLMSYATRALLEHLQPRLHSLAGCCAVMASYSEPGPGPTGEVTGVSIANWTSSTGWRAPPGAEHLLPDRIGRSRNIWPVSYETAVSRLRLSDPQRHRLYISAFVPSHLLFNETLSGLRLHPLLRDLPHSYSPKLACDARIGAWSPGAYV
uniref:GDSL esterase/lipase n=1 Tax=Macrostomum lignano TaxID=282301 RepID=A0A1I8FKB7_9PLAT